MFHETVTFCAKWVAPAMTAGFFALLPLFLNNLKPGQH